MASSWHLFHSSYFLPLENWSPRGKVFSAASAGAASPCAVGRAALLQYFYSRMDKVPFESALNRPFGSHSKPCAPTWSVSIVKLNRISHQPYFLSYSPICSETGRQRGALLIGTPITTPTYDSLGRQFKTRCLHF